MKELVEKVAALYADFSKDANAQIGNRKSNERIPQSIFGSF